MKRILNFRDFNVFSLEKEVWDIDYHNHNFYELILVENGKGKHRLNDITFPYKKGDVYLLTPSDAHEFVIERKTRFLYVKFTKQFVLDNLLLFKRADAMETVKLLLLNRPVTYKSAIKSKTDTAHVFELGKMLHTAYITQNIFKDEMISHLFLTVLLVLAKSFSEHTDKKKWMAREDTKIDKILSYINIYALDKQKMKMENLAKEFLMSENYISIYVKKSTGLSIQNHILQFKIKAAEKMLKQSRFNINEISERLGFNDASHFNKIFKKYNKMAPLEYRTTK